LRDPLPQTRKLLIGCLLLEDFKVMLKDFNLLFLLSDGFILLEKLFLEVLNTPLIGCLLIFYYSYDFFNSCRFMRCQLIKDKNTLLFEQVRFIINTLVVQC
jgi:hypothetical protein